MTKKPNAPLTGDAAAAEGLRMAFDAEDRIATTPTEAAEEGDKAFADGLHRHHNPYSYRDARALNTGWKKGWDSAAKADTIPPLYNQFEPQVVGYVKKVLGTEYDADGNITAQVSDAELYRFLHIAHRCQLDPLAGQIHLVGRWDQRKGRKVWTAQTSIDGYRLVAQRTGELAGSTDVWFDDGMTAFEYDQAGLDHPRTASITVRRIVKGQMCDATATARWAEYAPTGGQAFMWKKMPTLMLGKVAEALALRRMFPAELSGIYTDAEMDQADDPPSTNGTTVFDDRPKIEDPAALADITEDRPAGLTTVLREDRRSEGEHLGLR